MTNERQKDKLEVPVTDEGILNAFLVEQGIKISDSEVRKGNNIHQRCVPPRAIDEAAKHEADRIVRKTLSFMSGSENGYFRDASQFLYQFAQMGNALIEIHGKLDITIANAAHIMREVAGRILWVIAVSADQVLNKLDANSLALVLTHEIEHVRSSVQFQDSLDQNLPIRERLRLERERGLKYETWLEEEARAEGMETLAYTIHHGLTDYNDPVMNKDAVALIRAGLDIESPHWRQYAKESILTGSREALLPRIAPET